MYLLLVTGMSGAGKTNVLKRLEDIGFFCVDNLPCGMLPGFVQLCEQAITPLKRAAVVVDSRELMLGENLHGAAEKLDESGVHYDIVFLDCRDEVLERRFHETRRPHPLGTDTAKAIRKERELLTPLQYRAKYVIDTSSLTPMELLEQLESIIHYDAADSFLLCFKSFGFKRGVPLDADLVFDMRFTANPFYEPALRHLSGLDAPVRDFVMEDADAPFFFDTLESLIRRLIPRFIQQGKRRLTIALGCTGGRHRSVCAAQELYTRFKGQYQTNVIHRDIIREQQDIQNR